MFGKIFKGLAIAAGVGFAIGSVGLSKRRAQGRFRNSSERQRLYERLDRVESRIAAVEALPSPAAAAGELNVRLEAQAGDIEALRLQMAEYRQKLAADIASLEKHLADVTKGIPAMLESIVAPRVDDLRLRLRSEMQQSLTASLTTFERSIDDKVSDRISALEKAMLDQSALVTTLSQRAIESDMNLQRLIAAVERLCDRPGLNPDARAAAA